ncbi:unnamed protein product, partial [Heterosigma akashiwo]
IVSPAETCIWKFGVRVARVGLKIKMPYCSLCKISCPSDYQMQEHLVGRKHSAAAAFRNASSSFAGRYQQGDGTNEISGSTLCDFGKHRGKQFRDIFASDPGYVDWILLREPDPHGMPGFNYLRAYCFQQYAKGQVLINFGKHNGTTYQDVFNQDQGYVNWVLCQESGCSAFAQFQKWCQMMRAHQIQPDEQGLHHLLISPGRGGTGPPGGRRAGRAGRAE